jgi:tellurite resistance protein
MTTQPEDPSTSLENAFFARQNAALLAQFRQRTDAEARREQLKEIVKIQDDAFVTRLMTLGVTPATALAVRLVPLVFVAWADGELDAREREAVQRAARERGVAVEAAARALLDDWLSNPPDPRLLERWKAYIRTLWPRFTADERWRMRSNVLQAATEVADAAGGFLGLTSKVSAEERKLLDELGRLLD